ncbi:ABC transporter permease [soil metagenome]
MRYKQTVIGVAWAVIRPLLTIVVFSIFRSLLDNTGELAKSIMFTAAATLPWQLFSSALNESSNSLIANSNLITKVYFPRLIIPLSTVIVCLIDFLITLVIVIGVMAYYHTAPDIKIFLLPLFLMLALFSSIGAGVFLSALNVKYRDFRYIVPFIIQLGLYISPVAFSSELIWKKDIPEAVKVLYCFNPMVGVIDGFQWCLFGTAIPENWLSVKISCAVTLVMLIIGTWYFRRVEKNFADII